MKILAFDLINTLIDVSQVPKEDLDNYAKHLRYFQETGDYIPWFCPSSIVDSPPHKNGVLSLWYEFDYARDAGWMIVAMSNMQACSTVAWASKNGVTFDCIVPLEAVRKYKPHYMAYKALRNMFYGDRVVMVTANKTFGDLEGAVEAGMESRLIRHPGCPQTITELVESLR